VLEQYQTCAIGDWAFNMNSLVGKELPLDESNAFRVGGFEINEWLLWQKPDSTWRRSVADERAGARGLSWSQPCWGPQRIPSS
jgi:hypothetical protein